MRSQILSMESRQITAQSTFDVDCRVVKLCARVAQRPWLLRNRMSESFTYGSVGGVGYNLGGNSRGRPAPTRNGTPQGYLSCRAAGRTAASMDVKRRSMGARDLNADMRPEY